MDYFDYSRYHWSQDDKIPRRYKREACGGELMEDIWNVMNHGEQNLFIGVYARLSDPNASFDLFEKIRCAWKSLRWDVPTIACSTMHVQNGQRPPKTFITYDVAYSIEEVDEWARQTVNLKDGFSNLDDLRYDVGQEPVPAEDLGLQTFLYVALFSATTFGVLLRTSHVPFDGAGTKILMSKLFGHLTHYITDPDYALTQNFTCNWGMEWKNLLPAKMEALGEIEAVVVTNDAENAPVEEELTGESRDGLEFSDSLSKVLTSITTSLPRAHVFKSFIHPPFNADLQKPSTRRLAHIFTAEQSVKIKKAGYDVEGTSGRLTVNHLIHGALCLLPVIDNPPTNPDGVLFYYGLVDGRPCLAKKYRGPLDFPGYCIGMSPIIIPISFIHSLPLHDHKASVLSLAGAVQLEYKKQKELPSLVSMEPQLIESMLSYAPPPPPSAFPSYSGDGVGSRYLLPKYPMTGPTVIEITDFFVGLNKCDPGPFFRTTEWNGRIMLSVDFNEKAVEATVVQGWMDKWRELILSLTF
ncbi:hypothetical protein BDQ12DRAFT_684799 [Crucibulum laeve]|uniref:Transferase n=1 Tax=Crucibulum laeve TaxID=68775 RepID=A0A5C3LXT5_9AGAR|nr:hypothetical protein BDQ12DRAFT_684799 [Crucibulum laeve]